MGYEYKIITKLSNEQVKDISTLLERQSIFQKKHHFEDKEHWHFKKFDNNGKMPSFFIIFETDGIYVCKNNTTQLWQDLEELKTYFETNQIHFYILDYSDS